jgi:hypothetical protein
MVSDMIRVAMHPLNRFVQAMQPVNPIALTVTTISSNITESDRW